MAEATATKEKKTPKPKASKAPAKPATKAAPKKEKQEKSAAFAVIETGGKQYRVQTGDVIQVEKITGRKEGDKVEFSILLSDSGSKTDIGMPYLEGKKAEGTIMSEERAKKIHVIRYKAKSRYFRKYGHRQPYMNVEITKI